jgi:hypothetical protein
MGKQEAFDLEWVYDAEIAPLMSQVIEICKNHNLPMFSTFLYANDEDNGPALCTSNVMPDDVRSIPDNLLSLVDVVMPRRVPALHMKLTKADGSVEHTVILG